MSLSRVAGACSLGGVWAAEVCERGDRISLSGRVCASFGSEGFFLRAQAGFFWSRLLSRGEF